MLSTWTRNFAFFLFYASFTILPVVGWTIGQFSEYISYSVLIFWAVAPMVAYLAIKTILNEDPFQERASEPVSEKADS